jgi:hypothetical protein
MTTTKEDKKLTYYPRSGWQLIVDRALARCEEYCTGESDFGKHQLGARAIMRALSALAEINALNGATPGTLPPPNLLLSKPEIRRFYEDLGKVLEYSRIYGQYILACFDTDHGLRAETEHMS